MSQNEAKPLKCPICRKEVPTSSPDVPFCSDRCRLIDLGKWASGDYKIVSPIMDPDLLEEIEQAQLKAEMLGEPETRWKN